MFKFIFWILAIWFVINVIWMWFKLDNQSLQKTFAWINVIAVIIGFWVYYGVSHDAGGSAQRGNCMPAILLRLPQEQPIISTNQS